MYEQLAFNVKVESVSIFTFNVKKTVHVFYLRTQSQSNTRVYKPTLNLRYGGNPPFRGSGEIKNERESENIVLKPLSIEMVPFTSLSQTKSVNPMFTLTSSSFQFVTCNLFILFYFFILVEYG